MQPKKKLNLETVGIIFGSFTPFHIGHDYIIKQAMYENDRALVFVSNTTPEREKVMEEVDLILPMRYYYIKETYKDKKYIITQKLDESDIPPFPTGWSEYLDAIDDRLKELFKYPDNMDITIYTKANEFKPILNELRPHWKVKEYDPQDIPFTPELLLGNPVRYQNAIMEPYRKHLMNDYDLVQD